MYSAYITKLSKYFPNNPVSNGEMEKYLGVTSDKSLSSKRIVLGRNKIQNRYYAMDEHGNVTHSNAEITSEAVKLLGNNGFSLEEIELLCCGTTSPDQLIPSHASMVHGLLDCSNAEIASFSGSCCTGMQAMKYAFMSIVSGSKSNAISSGSERISPWLTASVFENEVENLSALEKDPYISFEKEFLRWMLSDGAAAALIQNKPTEGLNLKIEWIDICSYAHEMETCLCAGGDKLPNGNIKGWSEHNPDEWLEKSVFSLKQDVKLLGNNIVEYGLKYLKEIVEKRKFDIKNIDYFLPHLSSEFFRSKISELLDEADMHISQEKWFTNLTKVGNVGAASIYLMLEELMNSDKLIKGNQILLMVPESARFSYAYALLTVC